MVHEAIDGYHPNIHRECKELRQGSTAQVMEHLCLDLSGMYHVIRHIEFVLCE